MSAFIARGEFYVLRHKWPVHKGGYLHAGGWGSYVLMSEKENAVMIPGKVLEDSAYDWRMNWEAERIPWEYE